MWASATERPLQPWPTVFMRVWHPAGYSASPAANWHLCTHSWFSSWDGWTYRKDMLSVFGRLCLLSPVVPLLLLSEGEGLMEQTWHVPASCQEYSQQKMSSAPSPAGCQANASSAEVWGRQFPPLWGTPASSSEAPCAARGLPKEGGPLSPLQCANVQWLGFLHIYEADSLVFWGFSTFIKPRWWLRDVVPRSTYVRGGGREGRNAAALQGSGARWGDPRGRSGAGSPVTWDFKGCFVQLGLRTLRFIICCSGKAAALCLSPAGFTWTLSISLNF